MFASAQWLSIKHWITFEKHFNCICLVTANEKHRMHKHQWSINIHMACENHTSVSLTGLKTHHRLLTHFSFLYPLYAHQCSLFSMNWLLLGWNNHDDKTSELSGTISVVWFCRFLLFIVCFCGYVSSLYIHHGCFLFCMGYALKSAFMIVFFTIQENNNSILPILLWWVIWSWFYVWW